MLLSEKQLEHNRVTVHRRFSPKVPTPESSADQLKQVFLNLILNAQQAMPEGGELTVSTSWDGPAHEVRIAFTDTGVGIPAENLNRIFEPFYTSRPDGTGLGLSISYNIVEQQGGRIEAESQTGVGSTLTVVLPVTVEATAEATRQDDPVVPR